MNLAFKSLRIPDLAPQSIIPTVMSCPVSSLVMPLQVTSATRLLSEGAGMALSLLATPSRSDPSEVMAPLTVPPVRILMTSSRVSMPDIAGMP